MVLSQELVATLITVAGGIIASIIAWFLSKGKTKADFATELRNELRTDVLRWRDEARAYKDEVQKLRIEVDSWREKYYSLQNNQVKLEEVNQDLLHDMDRIKKFLQDNNINFK